MQQICALINVKKVKTVLAKNKRQSYKLYLLDINNKCIYHLNLGKDDFGIAKRNVGDTCSFANNPKCFITSESNYNSTCCTSDHPCGIAQGGCETDLDCFDNLECSTDNCGLEANGTKCCQAPGRKPSTLIKLIFMVTNISYVY